MQQMDIKVLLSYLKGNPNGSTVNIVNVGKVGDGENTKILIDVLRDRIEELRAETKQERHFDVMNWIAGFPQPRYKNMLKAVVTLAKERFELQREAAEFLGVSPRQFCYWMKIHKIPGYKPVPRKKKKKEEEK